VTRSCIVSFNRGKNLDIFGSKIALSPCNTTQKPSDPLVQHAHALADRHADARPLGVAARPSGNTTGVSILADDMDGKRQEILVEAVPGIRRMAALADTNLPSEAALNALQEAARAGNIELSIHRTATGEEIAAALDRAKASGATALNVLASPVPWTHRRLIMDRAAALPLPAIYQWAEMAEEGGFTAY
jgi:hypothetical protein